MMGYWGRILGAFVLLKVASRIMKDAEQVLSAAQDNKLVEAHGEAISSGWKDGVTHETDG